MPDALTQYGDERQATAEALTEAARLIDAARSHVAHGLTIDFGAVAELIANAGNQLTEASAGLESAEHALNVAAIVYGSNLERQRATGLNDNEPEPAA